MCSRVREEGPPVRKVRHPCPSGKSGRQDLRIEERSMLVHGGRAVRMKDVTKPRRHAPAISIFESRRRNRGGGGRVPKPSGKERTKVVERAEDDGSTRALQGGPGILPTRGGSPPRWSGCSTRCRTYSQEWSRAPANLECRARNAWAREEGAARAAAPRRHGHGGEGWSDRRRG